MAIGFLESEIRSPELGEQLTFPAPFYEGHPIRRPKNLYSGSTATDVLQEILILSPEITHISYTFYSAHYKSEDGFEIPELHFLPREEVTRSHLNYLTACAWGEANQLFFVDQDKETYETPLTMAITSLVKLHDGSTAHIPMMDLYYEDEELEPELLLPDSVDVLSRYCYSGALLESGNGFHFWGFRLLTPSQWERFIDLCTQQACKDHIYTDNEVTLFDNLYLEACKKAGFSAMRIFDRPPEKPKEPKVIQLIWNK